MRLIELFGSQHTIFAISTLVEGYKEAATEFAAASDQNTANTAIEKYKTLVTKNQATGIERNIDHWRKQGWDNFVKFIDSKADTPTSTQIKRKKVAGKSITIQEDDNWLIVVPLDKNASCFHGKDSNWCTTKLEKNYFNHYFHNNNITLVYCLQKQTGGMWAVAIHKDLPENSEIFDKADDSITSQEFSKQTGLDVYDLHRRIVGKDSTHNPTLDATRTDHKKLANNIYIHLNAFDAYKRDPDLEKKLLSVEEPDMCELYIQKLWSANREQKLTNYPEEIAVIAAKNDSSYANVWTMVSDKNEKVHIATLTSNPSELGAMLYSGYKPSEEAQLAAVTADGLAISDLISYGIEPSDKVIYAAVLNDPTIAGYLEDQKELGIQIPLDLQLAVIKKHGKNGLRYLISGGLKVYRKTQEAAIKQDASTIEYISMPDSELQMLAVQTDPASFKHIRYPTPNVTEYMDKLAT